MFMKEKIVSWNIGRKFAEGPIIILLDFKFNSSGKRKSPENVTRNTPTLH